MATTGKTAAGTLAPVARSTGRQQPAARPSDKGTGIKVANTVHLDPDNPIPFEIGGEAFISISGAEYLPFMNPTDDFATTLLEARLLSPTQSGCINSKTTYFVGNGIKVTNLKEGEEPDPTFTALVAKANGKRQSLNRVFEKICDLYQTFGNTPLEIVRGTAGGKKYVYIYPKSMLEARLGKPDSNGEINYALVSKRFRRRGMLHSVKDMKPIPIYKPGRLRDADNWLKDGKVERTMIWLKNEVAGYDEYGMPESISSLLWQLLEYDEARYNKDQFENNLVAACALFIKSGMSQTEANNIAATIIRRHTGKGRVGRTAVFSSENGIDDIKVVQFDTKKEGSYKELKGECEDVIVFANKWDAELASLKKAGGLAKGGSYLKEIYDRLLKSVIIPFQTRLLEDTMPSLSEIFKIWTGADWSRHTFGFEAIQLDNKTSELATTVAGAKVWLEVILYIAGGIWEQSAAEKWLMAKFGLSQQEVNDQLGNIKMNKDVLSKLGGKAGDNNPGGSN